jgi:glycosyltransferase involved in cell wall biosynthesis
MFMPTFARMHGGLLQRAVDSALAQSFRDFELLIVDDGSIDGTAQYLEQVQSEDGRVTVIRLERNCGLPAWALSRALPSARGRYFAWLFDDCELAPNHLELLVDALEQSPEAGLAYAKAKAWLDDEVGFEIGVPFDLEAMERGTNVVPNVCALVRREAIDVVGWYDPHVLLKRLCDWDLWLRVGRRFPVVFVDEVLAREGGVGLEASLGRLYDTAPDVVLKLTELDRTARLDPKTMALDQAFTVPAELSLSDAERDQVEFLLFEHAFLTADMKRTHQFANRMSKRPMLQTAMERFRVQNNREPVGRELTVLVSRELVRRRLARGASSQIEAEKQTRTALRVAAERLAMIDLSERRITELADEANSLRSSLEVSGRLRQAASKELAETTDLLLVYRDAADQRLNLLQQAHARIDELTSTLHAATEASTASASDTEL